MLKLAPLIPLLASAGFLIFGNGLQTTLIAWRGAEIGFPTSLIGLITAGYYLGFAIGCGYVTRLIRMIGHIRTFAAMASIGTVTVILTGLAADPWLWLVLRFVNGFCFAVLFAVIESWINDKVDNSYRGRALSVYRYVDLSSNAGAQYFLPWFGSSGFVLFGISAIALSLAITPITLADKSSPSPPGDMNFNIAEFWRVSPLAAAGCVAVGLTNTVYRSLGPVYTHELGFGAEMAAGFVAAGIISGVVLQYPLGYLSDVWDRRNVILMATTGALAASLFMFGFSGTSMIANIAGVFVLGAFSMPLYSLSSAHANDRAGPGQFAVISAGTLFFWALGATLGPYTAATLMGWFGAKSLFAFTATVQVFFIAYIMTRLLQRPG